MFQWRKEVSIIYSTITILFFILLYILCNIYVLKCNNMLLSLILTKCNIFLSLFYFYLLKWFYACLNGLSVCCVLVFFVHVTTKELHWNCVVLNDNIGIPSILSTWNVLSSPPHSACFSHPSANSEPGDQTLLQCVRPVARRSSAPWGTDYWISISFHCSDERGYTLPW